MLKIVVKNDLVYARVRVGCAGAGCLDMRGVCVCVCVKLGVEWIWMLVIRTDWVVGERREWATKFVRRAPRLGL